MNRVWRLIGSLGGSKMAEAFFITLATDTIIDIISAPLYSALLQSQYQPLKVDNPNLYTLLLNDSRNLYIYTSDIRSNELGGLFLNACTGLYFLLAIDEAHRPTNTTPKNGTLRPEPLPPRLAIQNDPNLARPPRPTRSARYRSTATKRTSRSHKPHTRQAKPHIPIPRVWYLRRPRRRKRLPPRQRRRPRVPRQSLPNATPHGQAPRTPPMVQSLMVHLRRSAQKPPRQHPRRPIRRSFR